MYRTVCFLAFMVASYPAMACSIEDVAGQIQFAAIQRAAELSTQQKPILDRFKVLNAKGKEPDKPIGQQLSQSDLAEFAQLQQRFQSIELLQLLESNFKRDNLVIKRIYEIAQQQYLGAPIPKEGDEKFILYAVLALMKIASEDPQIQSVLITTPSSMACTMEMAIHEIENKSFGRFNRLPIRAANEELKGILERNHITKVEREELNSSDREIYDRIQRTAYAPASRENSFIVDLESLKLLARTAVLKYELGKKDAIDSGGDINAVGNSVDALNLDMRQRMGFNMLDKIAEKFPSDWVKEKEQIQAVMNSVTAKTPAKPLAKKIGKQKPAVQ
jgi:hypothetical protein